MNFTFVSIILFCLVNDMQSRSVCSQGVYTLWFFVESSRERKGEWKRRRCLNPFLMTAAAASQYGCRSRYGCKNRVSFYTHLEWRCVCARARDQICLSPCKSVRVCVLLSILCIGRMCPCPCPKQQLLVCNMLIVIRIRDNLPFVSVCVVLLQSRATHTHTHAPST